MNQEPLCEYWGLYYKGNEQFRACWKTNSVGEIIFYPAKEIAYAAQKDSINNPAWKVARFGNNGKPVFEVEIP